ncbi:MAG TPA: sugar kinase [Steroidobacteraceae bacterium]|nr:sugar kinase [Steroidobacteraceae bacterium]
MVIVSIGECMLELAGQVGGAARLAFGGDTFNTAIYLARLQLAPCYLTALGTDPFSEEMLAVWRAEGIRTHLVARIAGRMPGLYAIRTSPLGERSFFYWRRESAARALFESADCGAALEPAAEADLLYFSGISLSLLSRAGRMALRDIAARVRGRGAEVAFDPNYRPACWKSADDARAAIAEIAPHVSIALPTLDDERTLWGDETARAAVARWRDFGAREQIVKLGADGALAAGAEGEALVPASPPRRISDTTGAGDAFNAGYLAMRLRGGSQLAAARLAHALASIVVEHPGAIAPFDATSSIAELLDSR